MESLRSTFPLDETAITRAALSQVLFAPITWAPLVPVVAAYTIFDVPAFFVGVFGIVVLIAITAYWRKQWRALTDGLRRQRIRDHNLAQNALLKKGASDLRRGGAPDYANRLEEFLDGKILVERRLHEDGALSEQKIQIEQLVDSLCFGVWDQLSALAGQEKKHAPGDRKATLARVSAAFETLQSTVAELDTILGPSEGPATLTGASLEEITRRLREEAEIARRVRARLRLPESPESPESPQTASAAGSSELSPVPGPPRGE